MATATRARTSRARPAKTAAVESEIPTTRLLVTQGSEDFILTIPSTYKVTFSAPFGNKAPTKGGFYGGPGGRELRIYESETIQRACFTGVTSFRDLSLPYTRVVETVEAESSLKDDGEVRQASSTRKRSTRLIEEEF